jgi:hypothetical protein
VGRKAEVTSLGGSLEGTQPVAKKSYRVKISEDGKSVVIEARITFGTLETLPEPEKWIAQYFNSHPLPKDKEVIDMKSV